MKRGYFAAMRCCFVFAILFAMSSLSGCGVSRPKPQEFDKVLDSETVVMLDRAATSQLTRQKEWVEVKNGFMEPHLILRNQSGKVIYVEIRTYFKDQNGGTLETATDTWDPVTINPHEDYHYYRMCTKTEGAGYQFHVRMGKEKH